VNRWTTLAPPASLVVLAVAWVTHPEDALGVTLVAVFLVAAVLAAVYHAEVVAHRVGDPLGSLILAVAVTVIEVALIVTLMVAGGDEASTLARDTVFAAVMITCNGIIGLSLLVATLRHRTASFNAEGTASALATVATLATLSLVVPSFTTSRSTAEFSPLQLTFAALASLVLYALFVLMQTVRHRDYFLPAPTARHDPEHHAEPPTRRAAVTSLWLLLVSLVAVVGLAKLESPAIEDVVADVGAPQSAVGVIIALVVLLPETLAAYRNARSDRMQSSFNLGFGSAMASIGLTIPVIALASIWLAGPLELGLGPKDIVLLALTLVISTLTTVMGRANVLQGAIHLVVFGAFIFLAVTP